MKTSCSPELSKVSLLSGNTESSSASTGGLRSLTSDSDTPEVSETSMLLDFSHSLEILSQHGIELVRNKLAVLAVSWIVLSVEEPLWNVVVGWASNDIADLLDFFVSDLASSLIDVDLSNLKSKERESSSDTSDLSEAEWGLLFTVQVGVLNTKNVFEFTWIRKD